MTQNEHIYTIFCRAEVAGDVLSGENVKAIEGYALLHFEAALFSGFRENKKSAISVMRCVDDGRPTWAPFSGSRRTNAVLSFEVTSFISLQDIQKII